MSSAQGASRTLLPHRVGEAVEVGVYDVRVQRADVRLGEAELVHAAVLVGVGYHVRLADELLCALKLLRDVEVELDGVLASPAVELEHGLLLVLEVAAAHQQHVRAVLGQDAGARRGPR